MKQLRVLFVSFAVSMTVALAATVKLQVTTSTGPTGNEATSFSDDTPKIFARFKTEGVTSGDKIRAELIAEDVGDAAPANTKVLDKTLELDGDTQDGVYDFSKPTKGW